MTRFTNHPQAHPQHEADARQSRPAMRAGRALRAALFTALLCGPTAAWAQWPPTASPLQPINDHASSDGLYIYDQSPDMVTDGLGTWIAVWESNALWPIIGGDYDVLVARSEDNGATWSAAEVLNSYAADDEDDKDLHPHIATDGAGTWIAAWSNWGISTGNYDYDVRYAVSNDDGLSWTTAAFINDDALTDNWHDFHPTIAFDGSTWIIAWERANTGILFSTSTNAGQTWSESAQLSPSDGDRHLQPHIAADGQGTCVAVWHYEVSGETETHIMHRRSVDGGQSWEAAGTLDNGSYSDALARVGTDGQGNWIVAWANWTSNDNGGTRIVRSTNDGLSWSSPQMLHGGEIFGIDLACDGAGNWVVVSENRWYSDSTVDEYELLLVHSPDAGASWSEAESIGGHPGWTSGTHGEPRVVRGRWGRWLVTWGSNYDFGGDLGEDWDVLASGFDLDCNANGVPDDEDVDADGNGVPDDCEVMCGNAMCELPEEDSCSCPQDCGAAPALEVPGQTCGDGLDNDCDGLADCADGADCLADTICPAVCGDAFCTTPAEDTCGCPQDCGAPPENEALGSACLDGLDNDCDGLTDCEDLDDCSDQPACGGACDGVADCADLDGNGVRDDNCVWTTCAGQACSGEPIVFADMGGSNGACEPDGTADANDRFHALNCFSNSDTLGNTPYPCEPNTPQAYNVDAGGPFGACAPDGVCDGNDAFHALNAFTGNSTCSCPTGGGPLPDFDAGPHKAHAVGLWLEAAPRLAPNDLVAVDVYLDGALPDLRGYQLHIAVQGGQRGRLELVDILIEARRDHALHGLPEWSAFQPATGQMLAGLDGAGVRPLRDGYLATYLYRPTADACGTFVVDARYNADDPLQRTYLFPTRPADRIEVSGSRAAEISVDAKPGTATGRRGR